MEATLGFENTPNLMLLPLYLGKSLILKVSNGPAESMNSRIKTIKVRRRGFRNKERFANAIYFYLGGLDLYRDGVRN